MTWNRWYTFKSFIRSALWITPFFAVVAAALLKRISEAFGKWAPEQGLWVRGQAFFNLQPAEAVGYIDRIFTMNL